MDPRVVTTLKLAAFIFFALFAFAFGTKHYKRWARQDELATEMRSLVSDASFYRSPTAETAHGALFRGIAMIDEAKSLGLEPSAYFDRVFNRETDKKRVDDEFEEYPAREKLARETLLRAYQHAAHFALLENPEDREILASGRMPDVVPKPVVGCIIDPALSPGIEKIVPNLALKAAGPAATPTDLDIAAAKNLASDLYSARVIDYDLEKKVADSYRPKVTP